METKTELDKPSYSTADGISYKQRGLCGRTIPAPSSRELVGIGTKVSFLGKREEGRVLDIGSVIKSLSISHMSREL